MIKIKNIALSFALCLLTSCMATNNLAATPVMAGGYYAVESNHNKEVEAAALFAVQTQTKREHKSLKLIAVSKAMQQVVAGMNYQLELIIKSGEKTAKANVVVFHSLNNTYELTSWQWLPAETAN